MPKINPIHPIVTILDDIRTVKGISRFIFSEACGMNRGFWQKATTGRWGKGGPGINTIGVLASMVGMELVLVPKDYLGQLEHELKTMSEEINTLKRHVSTGFIRDDFSEKERDH